MSSQTLLGLDHTPVAIGFLDTVPEGVAPWDGGDVPAGCSFWRAAQQGKTFATTPEDHYNCAVGAHTHGIPLPMARADELMQTVGFMVESGYVRMEEVPGIPTLPTTPAVIAYGPVDDALFPPSVVILTLTPERAMVVYEAALLAGATPALLPSLGRPACAVLPLSLQTGAAAISLGCKGNRTFTGIGEGEMYLSIPGERWPALLESFTAVAHANDTMGDYYTKKQANFATKGQR